MLYIEYRRHNDSAATSHTLNDKVLKLSIDTVIERCIDVIDGNMNSSGNTAAAATPPPTVSSTTAAELEEKSSNGL